jgi:rod shape-determining protein MreD
MVPVLLLDDILLMRPLGLWTLIVLLVSENLRRRVDHTQLLPFWSEVALVSICIAMAHGLNHLALLLLLAETPPLAGQGLQALTTIVTYPFIALFSQLIGVRRLAPGELDALGGRA